ncbi:hypothetical protein HMPREF9145_1687 [Segatella salivae F0493]|uniref:Uncharacterized protein n=1 Tax=Segatella salivae F0493 TaxID=1395125 RepID=U2KJR0_9BACT|nr:hypothetical protein HMPREF9145_1687 [Segatella salivae F0493]
MGTLITTPLAINNRAGKPHPQPRLHHFIARFAVNYLLK